MNNSLFRFFKSKSVLTITILVSSCFSISNAQAQSDLIKKGEEVFNTVAGIGCAGCHGQFAEGDLGVGPFLRGATDGSIRAAISGIGEMIAVRTVITEDQIEAVSAYVGYLGQTQVARTLGKRGRFLPDSFSTRPGTSLQLVIQNGSFKPRTYQSDDLGIEPITIPARSAGSFLWEAPSEEGNYTLSCTDCKLKDQFFTIKVDETAKKFNAIVPVSTLSGTM